MCGETDLTNVLQDSCRNRFEMLRSCRCLRGRALSACSLMCVVLMLSERRVWQQVCSMNNFTASMQDSTQMHWTTSKSLIALMVVLSSKYHYLISKFVWFTSTFSKPSLRLRVATRFFIWMFDLNCVERYMCRLRLVKVVFTFIWWMRKLFSVLTLNLSSRRVHTSRILWHHHLFGANHAQETWNL